MWGTGARIGAGMQVAWQRTAWKHIRDMAELPSVLETTRLEPWGMPVCTQSLWQYSLAFMLPCGCVGGQLGPPCPSSVDAVHMRKGTGR